MKRIFKLLLWVVPLVAAVATGSMWAYTAAERRAAARYHSGLQKSIHVSSSSFEHEHEIPLTFSCEGQSIAPDIQWTGAPGGAKSYALMAMDWDAPSPKFRLFAAVHWVLFNIPPGTTEIPQNSTNDDFMRKNIVPGLNFAGQPGYMAPCPPLGTHRYEFRVYALDVVEIRPSSNQRAGVMKAMDGHILAYGELVGLKAP